MKARSARPILAFLLLAAMLFSALGGAAVFAAEESVDYRPCGAFTEGMDCLVVAETAGGKFALSFDGEALGSVAVTETDGVITLSDKAAVWTARADDTIESAGTPGTFIFAGSHGFMVFTGGRTFEYDPETKTVLMHKMYYLTYDEANGKFAESLEAADAATITLYEPVPVYTKTDAFVEDDQYIIVDESGAALAFDGEALTSIPVTIEGDTITGADAAAAWTCRADSTVESVGTPGTFIFAGSHGFMVFTGGRTFEYDPETQTILMHKMYYLSFDAATGKFDETLEAAEAAKITIFGREMPKVAKEEKFIPDGSDLPEVERDAVANADGTVKLAFVTDIHYSTKYAQNNLQVWFDNVSDEVGYIDVLGSCGDMGSAYSVLDEYWENVATVIGYMDGNVESGKVGTTIYTFGNHEWYPDAGGNFIDYYENPAAQRLFRVGEAMKTDKYIIYCLGAGDIASKYSQGYSDADIERVAEYLKTAPTDKPIFVLTHFPIHFWGDRKEENAGKLLEVFNQYPNLVVLWGHNHSDFDENYDMIYRPGDTIQIDQAGTTKEINFTYLSAGCISDEEYTGAYGGSAWVQGKGLVVTIAADGSLQYDYYTMDGKPMHEDGPYLVEFRDGVTYSTLKTEYVEAGAAAAAPEVPTFDHYTFTGWDYDFDSVTRHLCVTAQYDFDVLRDPGYVYLTMTLGADAVKGKSGKDILLYPIPYTENMTIADAYAALQAAEYDGEAEVAASSRGFFSKIWGIDYATVPTDLPDRQAGSFVLTMDADDGYVAVTDFAKPGWCYYTTLYDEAHPQVTTSFVNPEETTAKAGEAVDMVALTWVSQPSYTYKQTLMNGDVYVGKSLDALADSGVDAVDGVFSLSFDADGTYYVAVKAQGAADAYAVVHVGGQTAAPAKTFTDVKAGDWFYDYVTRLTAAGVIDGYPDGSFLPDGTLTWVQAMKLLLCAHGDLGCVTGDNWEERTIDMATELGLWDAATEKTASISRLDFCKAAAKLFALSGAADKTFSDCDDADVLALAAAGVIDGYPDGSFRPAGFLTRAEISKIIFLLMK